MCVILKLRRYISDASNDASSVFCEPLKDDRNMIMKGIVFLHHMIDVTPPLISYCGKLSWCVKSTWVQRLVTAR